MFLKWLFDKEALDLVSNAATIGLHLVSATFIGLAIGYYLDQWLEVTKPWLTIAFLLVGIISGFLEVFRDAKRIQRAQADKEQADRDQAGQGPGAGPNQRPNAGPKAGREKK